VGVPSGTGPEPGARNRNPEPGTGPEPGAGTGPEPGAGTGPEPGAGAGPEPEPGTGTRSRNRGGGGQKNTHVIKEMKTAVGLTELSQDRGY